MGSWHGFQAACLGLDMLPHLLCMAFKCQYSPAHPHQLEVSHITGEESTQAQAYDSFTLFLCLLAQASQKFVGQLIIYSEDYILGLPERATNRFLL